MVEVQRLAVEVARRLADFEELLDLRVADVEIAGGRAAPQRALADRQRQAVHHPHERNDAAGLAVEPDRFADAADLAPVGADAAAPARQPDVLVPGADDAFEAVVDRVEIAADRQAAPGAAVRQHRRRRHEPQLRDVVIQPLGMVLVVGIGIGDAGEQVLVAFAGQQVAVVERFPAEVGQQRVARRIGDDGEAARVDRFRIVHPRRLGDGHDRFAERFGAEIGDQRTGARIVLFHGQCRACARLLCRASGQSAAVSAVSITTSDPSSNPCDPRATCGSFPLLKSTSNAPEPEKNPSEPTHEFRFRSTRPAWRQPSTTRARARIIFPRLFPRLGYSHAPARHQSPTTPLLSRRSNDSRSRGVPRSPTTTNSAFSRFRRKWAFRAGVASERGAAARGDLPETATRGICVTRADAQATN